LKTPDGGRVFRLLVLLTLAFSLSLPDIVYASPGPYVTGCRWLYQSGLWVIVALVSWVDAGSLLPIIVDLYKVIGGARVGRIQDSVSGTGSKEFTFSNIPGQADDRFIVDVQFFDANKNDWVHTPGRPGIMECPRPEAKTQTTTTTATMEVKETVISERQVQVTIPTPLTFGQQYWAYLLLLVSLVTLTLGYGLSYMTIHIGRILPSGRPPRKAKCAAAHDRDTPPGTCDKEVDEFGHHSGAHKCGTCGQEFQ